MLSFLSLILIFLGNSISTDGILICVSFPFISYIIRTKKNILFLVLTYVLTVIQTDKYLYFFFVVLFYIILNILIFSTMDYNNKTLVYILLLQIVFYILMTYNNFSVKYCVINGIGFIIFNYIYLKYILKENR